MSQQLTVHAIPFPSKGDRALLLQKSSSTGLGSFTNDERWKYHAYDYGWRRAAINDYACISPIDPAGKWFNGSLVARAEEMWRKFFGRPAPVQKTRQVPSAEDIAHVEQCCRQIRANLAVWTERNKRAFARPVAPTYVEDNADIAGLQRKLGVTAVERSEMTGR